MKHLFRFLSKELFSRKITIAKWELNLFGTVMIIIGLLAGSYLTAKDIIPKIFATSQASITYDTDSDFNKGTLASTQVSGTGSPAVVQLAGSGGPNGTQYKRTITIDNSGNSSTLSNYQVRFTFDSQSLITAGKMRSDCGDIRILDSDDSTALSYWVENGCNTSTTIVWVKVPSIPASSTKSIYFYYDAPSITSQSNGGNVFLFFDDFSGSSIDGTKWTKVDPRSEITESGGYLNLTTGKGSGAWDTALYSTSTFIRSNISEEFSMKWIGAYTPYSAFMWGWNTAGSSYTNLTYGYYNQGSTNPYSTWVYEDGNSRGAGTGSWATNTTYKVRVRMRSTGGAYYEQSTDNGATWSTSYTSTYSTASNLHMGFMLYSGDYQVWNSYIRNWTSPEPALTVGSEQATLQSSGTWESASNSNVIDLVWNGGWGDGTTGTSTAFSATVGSVGTNQTIAFQMRAAATTAALTSASYVTLGTVNSGTTFTQTKAQLDALGLGTGTNRYVQVKATFAQTTGTTPTLDNFTIYYAKDNTAPETNATSPLMYTSNGGTSIASSGWDNSSSPYFTWTAGSDSQSGIKGYCLYLGTDNTAVPSTSSPGDLNASNSPVSVSGTSCDGGNGFIVSGTSVDLSTSGYIGTALTSSSSPYYLGVAAVDNAGNVDSSFTFFTFYYDGTSPTNVSYISCASGNFSNVTDMNFSWPTSGSSASSDSNSGVLGWQYQIDSSTGTWQGTTHNTTLDLDYVPASASAYTLVSSRDSTAGVAGTHIIYFRTVDNSGNFSSGSTYRTCSLSYGGAAPTFPGNGTVTITPSTSTTNSFALSWPAATATQGQTVTHYYYMINNSPPTSLSTLQGNSGTYIDNSTNLTVAAGALANVVKGTNTVYVVAIDNAGTPNYSSSNYIKGTFTLNSTNPDPVQNLVATDSSIKSTSTWNVTLTWTAGSYQGAGNLTYNVYRSTDDVTFTKVGSTSGLSYVDNTPSSTLYYYYVVTKDGANASSSDSTTVSITPTGKYTSPPTLQSGPTAGSITTQSVTITWSTDRSSDSKVEYGTSSGSYNTTEPYVSDQVTSHSVTINNLTAGTTYYYKVKWTDSDGNTGTSSEETFSTSPAPTVKDVTVGSIGLSSATLSFTSDNASSVKIYYGTTTAFGSTVTLSTSTSETTYSQILSDLLDGTKYYYKINTLDSDGTEYEGTILDFSTLPRPKITSIQLAQVAGTAQPTVIVSWMTNTDISSIITYYPQGNPGAARDNVNVALTHGQHQMLLSGLDPKTAYQMVIKGRDKVGNEADSDTQTFTTATDTRPPYISSLAIEGESPTASSGQQTQTSQLVVTWNTDKLSTSQVEYGEGTGTTYSQKTQQDNNLTFNHLVIITGLTPSKVYHLKALSEDKYGNTGTSIDTVTITPKATSNALNLVISNLQQAFGFLGAVGNGGQ